MKAIIYIIMCGSNILLGGSSCNKQCAEPPDCVGGACHRNFDGSCNNLNKPSMGMAGMPYGRLCDDCYSDGEWAIPKSIYGKELPNARILSYKLNPEKQDDDVKYTQLLQQFGQFVAHDLSLASGVGQMKSLSSSITYSTKKYSEEKKDGITLHSNQVSCCDKDKNIWTKKSSDPRCMPVPIQKEDPVFNPKDTPCFQLSRTLTTNDKQCHSPYASYTPISDVTAWLDASMIYGNSENDNKKIREYKGGRLMAVVRNGQEWPPQTSDAIGACSFQSENKPCYMTGDFRANQSPQLAILHIVLFREHNRICKELTILNPGWNDEKTFQVARRIIIAILQHITYNHYLPAMVGHDAAVKSKLIYPDIVGFVNDYDTCVDPSILVEFATAAFRFCHTMVRGDIGMYAEDRQKTSSIWLRDFYLQPAILEEGNNLQDLTRGLGYQECTNSDPFFVVDITQFLLSRGNNSLGSDLRSFDIQRTRDHGVCTYVEVRKSCGLPVPRVFSDLLAYGITQADVDKIKELYESVKDMELVVVGALEPIEPGTRLGRTYLCVITKQFLRTRTGDRFFYQNGQDVPFTLNQLTSIQTGASMSRMFCDNVKGVESMQPNPFLHASQDNPLTPCGQLPSIDLKYWINSEC